MDQMHSSPKMADNLSTPPPIPSAPSPPPFVYKKRKKSYGEKILLLGVQCCVLMFGAFLIWVMSYSRDERNNNVASQIASEWGESVSIEGPMAVKRVGSADRISPATFNCDVNVETQSLHRNIYEAEVFNAHVSMSGTFIKDRINFRGDSVCLYLMVPARQVSNLSPLKIDGRKVEWSRSNAELFAEIDLSDMPEVFEFSAEFDIRGSGGIFVKQIGDKSFITIDGEAPNPSFNGSRLPNDRYVSGKKFSASWKDYEAPAGTTYKDKSGFVGTNFLVGVDRYQKVSRSLKYAFIIILLTYTCVLFTEIIMKRNIPLLNYFLIGAALILFYSLLLAFSELMSFGLSYLIGSFMTVALIVGYMWKMIGSGRVAMVMCGILAVMYGSCYIMLILSTYALLLGSMLLFIALAAMMYGSLKIKPRSASF